MKPNCPFVALAFVITSVITASAQNDSTFIARASNRLSQQPVIEKVYLQLDKPYYAAGDNIWFKAYVTAGGRHTLSAISGVLNVELINTANRIEHSVKLPLIDGLSWGDFGLPDTIKSGYYRIRAYTQWMRNAGTDYFYNKTLYIGNNLVAAASGPARPKKAEAKKTDQMVDGKLNKAQSAITDVQFFPESGNLLYGVKSTIAFKAVGSDGLGKDIKGIITDQNNNEITRFNSCHLGMGEFNLKAVEGQTYKALITFADGSEKGISLPLPQGKGYVMHVDNSDPLFIELKIEKGKNSNTEGINLLVQSGGEVYYAAQSKSQSSTTTIPKSKFPDGIAQFTLFSDKGEPLNERLVFIQHNRQLNLSVDPEGMNFATRDKMKINVAAKNEQGKPVFGNFSVAITDETKVPVDEATENAIFSNLLLISDLKGYIENPGYYFTPQSAEAVAHLDVLMLTQGYRRFEWKQILNNNGITPKYQPETSLAISGKLRSLGGGKAIPHGQVSLMSSSGGFTMLDTVADDQGHFVFKNLQFKDSLKFVIQSKKVNGSKGLRIEMDSLNPPPVTVWAMLPTASDTDFSIYMDNSKRVYDKEISYGIRTKVSTLKEVQIRDKIIKINSYNLNGPGNADQVVLMKDVPPAGGTIAEWLIGKLKGVFFKFDQEGGVYFPCTYIAGKAVGMRIMLNGINIDSIILATLSPETIESVEVLRSGDFTAIYGPDAYNGLILINTKKGADYTSSTNMKLYMPQGYYKAREFYSPQYKESKNQPGADMRTTIYWNPNVATDKDGNASVEYFNADAKGTYRVVIEGIDANGNLGRQVYRYKVE